ncbi:MAG: 2-phospho-L-lactate transferase [Chloroflexi bacterium RBG_16_68_14]|nr:MAG: 2-phospho-L-lactate transferase [Chloroflexi bacterium RBG_16_68_14]
MIAVLSGGVGGSRFLQGLVRVVPPEEVVAIVNTGDDEEFFGLYVSPDPDIVTYALGGIVDEERGWGVRGDTFRWLEAMRRFGHETWFQIGDRDLATHLYRTRRLREGATPSQVAGELAERLGVRARVLPMSDGRVRTVVETEAPRLPTGRGALPFQRYLVQRGARDRVLGLRFEGAGGARPAPGVLEALREAEFILIAPSDPLASIGPILALPGVREALASRRDRVAGVSPIVAGRSLRPPAAELLAGLGHEVSALGVARLYRDLARVFVLDREDAGLTPAVRELGLEPVMADTIMRDAAAKEALARATLEALG